MVYAGSRLSHYCYQRGAPERRRARHRYRRLAWGRRWGFRRSRHPWAFSGREWPPKSSPSDLAWTTSAPDDMPMRRPTPEPDWQPPSCHRWWGAMASSLRLWAAPPLESWPLMVSRVWATFGTTTIVIDVGLSAGLWGQWLSPFQVSEPPSRTTSHGARQPSGCALLPGALR